MQLEKIQLYEAFPHVPELFTHENVVEGLILFDFFRLQHGAPVTGRFIGRRNVAHKQEVDNLTKYRNGLLKDFESAQLGIAKLTQRRIEPLGRFCYDSVTQITLIRKAAFLSREIDNHNLLLNATLFEKRREKIKLINGMLQVLTEGVIPETVICCVKKNFFESLEDEEVTRITKERNAMITGLHDTRTRIENLPLAAWTHDFAGFLLSTVKKARSLVTDRQTLYVEASEGEDSLSRCLFGRDSPFKADIDAVINRMPEMNEEEFTDSIVKKAHELMASLETPRLDEQSMGLMILFRCIFNRCYEMFPDLRAGRGSEDLIKKMEELRMIEAGKFPIPWDLIRNGDKTTKLKELVDMDDNFRKAEEYLFRTVFVCNPIDALYLVHLAIETIQKGAVTNKCHGDIEEMRQTVIPFDDLFSLFFVVVVASEIPDVVFLQRLVCEFAPKRFLSPAFEYAQANVEAMMTHLHRVDKSNFV